MKQQIQPYQIKELSKNQMIKLVDWYLYIYLPNGNKQVSTLRVNLLETENPRETAFIPVLSIGMMIEILETNLPTLHINKHLKAGLVENDTYEVFQQSAGSHYGNNLCDALWEAVKKVL